MRFHWKLTIKKKRYINKNIYFLETIINNLFNVFTFNISLISAYFFQKIVWLNMFSNINKSKNNNTQYVVNNNDFNWDVKTCQVIKKDQNYSPVNDQFFFHECIWISSKQFSYG